ATARAPAGAQDLPVLTLALGDERVGGIEYALGRPVILFERDDRRRPAVYWGVLLRELENVFDGCCAKRVNRLRIVANDGHAFAILLQSLQDLCLQDVGV